MTLMNASGLISVVNFILTVLAALACAFVFRFVKIALRQAAAASAANSEGVTAALANVHAELEAAKSALRELQETKAAHQSRISEIGGINLNQKGQVLRLHRRGESVAAISSALRLPLGEVSLIVKVHEMSQNFLRPERHEKAL